MHATPARQLQPLVIDMKPRGSKDENDFGYKISLARPWAKGNRVSIDIQNQGRFIDVSGRPYGDLVGPQELPQLLARIASLGIWAKTATCQVWEHDRSGNVVNRHGPVAFQTPVKPLRAPRWPGMAATDRGSLIYTKPPGGAYDGSFLWHKEIDGFCYFMHAGKLITDNQRRGFDCITYCGSIFSQDARSGAMAERGDQLARKLGLLECGMEELAGQDIRSRLSATMSGTYLVWGGSHTVLCHNGVIHEFAESKKGYNETYVEDWHFSGGRWTARKSVIQFPNTARRYIPQVTARSGGALV